MGKIVDLVLGILRKFIPEGYMTKATGVTLILAGIVMAGFTVTGSDACGLESCVFSGESIATSIMGGLAALGIGDKIDRNNAAD